MKRRSLNGKTGHLTKIIDNLNNNKNREYEFDAVGRLKAAWGGPNKSLSVQSYAYDRYGNRTGVYVNGIAADGSLMPRDGIANLTYNTANNRITTAGFEYDEAGNQTRALAEDGVTWVKYEYDSANRLRLVKKDDGPQTPLQSFLYGSTNARLMSLDHLTNQWTLYASNGGTTLAEYTEFTLNVPTWTKSYTYLGSSQLSTITPNGSGGEYTEYNHPDRLGTRVITNQAGGTNYEQAHLPFGTALNAESTGSSNTRFTSYDRSPKTGLDYAINRTYDSKQGRFTQVDPIDIEAVDAMEPQTLNLYTYCGNDPVNHTDPDGLFWGFFKKLFKWLLVALAVVVAILTIVYAPQLFPTVANQIFGIIGAVANAASSVLGAFGLRKAALILSLIGIGASLGGSFLPKGPPPSTSWSANSFLDDIYNGGHLATVQSHPWVDSIINTVSTISRYYLNFLGGTWDALSFGYASHAVNSNLQTNVIDTNSGAYQAGEYCGIAASLAIPVGGVALRGVKIGSWALKASRYKHGGGGINLYKNGVRKLGLDYHKFKSVRTGKIVKKVHRHSGNTKSQMKKHKGVCSGKPL